MGRLREKHRGTPGSAKACAAVGRLVLAVHRHLRVSSLPPRRGAAGGFVLATPKTGDASRRSTESKTPNESSLLGRRGRRGGSGGLCGPATVTPQAGRPSRDMPQALHGPASSRERMERPSQARRITSTPATNNDQLFLGSDQLATSGELALPLASIGHTPSGNATCCRAVRRHELPASQLA